MKKKIKNNVRAIFIVQRTRNKKKEYYFLVEEYKGGDFSYNPARFNYPSFRKTFQSKIEARKYAYATAEKLERRYRNIRFLTRFLD